MSERMNKERAIEILKKLNDNDYYLLKPKKDKPFEIDSENRFDELHQALDIAIESLDNEWVDVRDRLPKQPYDKIFDRPALRTKPMLVSVNGDDWMKDKLYGTKNATYNQVILAYYSFRDNCWKDDDNEEIKRDGGIHSYEVIAWKPLPQPYERKE